MINVYEDADFDKALRLKKKLMAIYLVTFAITLIFCAVFFVFALLLPYASTDEIKFKKTLYLVLCSAATGIFIIWSFVYLGIPYKRARAYFRLMDDIKRGQKNVSESTFLQNDEGIYEVSNVDYHHMVVLEWSDKTQEYMRRNVLVDKEKPMPDLKSGDIIVYVTHANVLLSYGLKSEEKIFDGIDNV